MLPSVFWEVGHNQARTFPSFRTSSLPVPGAVSWLGNVHLRTPSPTASAPPLLRNWRWRLATPSASTKAQQRILSRQTRLVKRLLPPFAYHGWSALSPTLRYTSPTHGTSNASRGRSSRTKRSTTTVKTKEARLSEKLMEWLSPCEDFLSLLSLSLLSLYRASLQALELSFRRGRVSKFFANTHSSSSASSSGCTFCRHLLDLVGSQVVAISRAVVQVHLFLPSEPHHWSLAPGSISLFFSLSLYLSLFRSLYPVIRSPNSSSHTFPVLLHRRQ
mmetsp:Transcript_42794/g.91807  ORF Transcript_42794/g.91807 Transcript_42794/m.91807 type:complete len:274 (+) Transcript_42794:1200-2021(+)